MAKSLHNLLSFSGGETSPKVDARVDQPRYNSMLRQCLNMVPYKTGGLTRRVGTKHIDTCKLANTTGHDYTERLQPFTFSPTTTFMLGFGHGYVRFYTQHGNPVSFNAADLPFWVNVQAYNPGDYVQFGGLAYRNILATPARLPPPYNTNPDSDPTHWTQQAELELFTPYNGDAGSAGTQPGSIYGTDVWKLSFCQINDVVYIASPGFPVYSLTRFSDVNWVMKKVNFISPALLDQNATNTQIAASATTGTGITLAVTAPAWVTATYYTVGNSVEVSGVIYTCVVAHVSSGTFSFDFNSLLWQATPTFNALHVGSTWQLAYLRASAFIEYDGTAAGGFTDGTSSTLKALGSWEVHTYGVWSSDIAIQRSLDGGQTWDTVRTITGRSDRNIDLKGTAVQTGLYRIVVSNSAALVNAGATNPRIVFESVDSFLYGLVQITAVASPISATATVVTELASTSPTEYWSEAAWSDYRGYPQAVASFQQRVIYASSGFEPQRIWGTVTNDIENFALGDQTKATDGFAFDLNAQSRGPIQWLIGQTDLFAGFAGAEWVINSGSSNATGQSSGAAIGPTSINAVEHSSWGSAPYVAPAIVGDAVLFTQRQATSLRQMMFSIYTNKYMSQDLTTAADHLFASGIAQLCYMTRWRKQSIIWAVTKQGTLCGMTYELDQEVFGWHRHNTGYGQVDANGVAIPPDAGFESVQIMDGLGIQDDQVWVVVNRLINGVPTRYIERMDPTNWEEWFDGAPTPPYANLSRAYYVDAGQVFITPGSLDLTGLTHLKNRYVVGLADGYAVGPLLVDGSGGVTLPPSIPTSVAYVLIGLPISYAGQPMRIDSDARAGNTQGLIKQISDIYVRVWNSVGGSISNGSRWVATWVSGASYVKGALVLSPTTRQMFECVVDTSGTTDPASSTDWQVCPGLPNYKLPVPIPYVPPGSNPFASPVFVSTPTDIRLTPWAMPWPNEDPVFVVQGNDALPLTVLALTLKYDITASP